MSVEDPEIEFLRTVEDLFTTLRGVPHILSPKDVELARSWWRDGLPIAAVNAGVTEIIDRRKRAGETDPVVSLTYCRHAVKKHARRLAERRLGDTAGAFDRPGETEAVDLAPLIALLSKAAEKSRDEFPRASESILKVANRLKDLSDLPPTEVDEGLYALESALLEGCRRGLDNPTLDRLKSDAAKAAVSSGAVGAARTRAETAFFDRNIRDLFHLPRLEIL